jgi:tetratricopeptide (TPR) repeat protein
MIRWDPSDAEAYLLIGTLEEQSIGDLTEAMKGFNKAISLDPANADSYNDRGTLELKTADYKAALRDFRKAVKMTPNNVYYLNNLGIARKRRGDVKGAIHAFTMAIAADPSYGASYYNRGLAKIGSGDQDGGNADLQKATAMGYAPGGRGS